MVNGTKGTCWQLPMAVVVAWWEARFRLLRGRCRHVSILWLLMGCGWLRGFLPAVTSTVSSLIEMCDRILKGQEVDLNSVEAVQQAVLRGDIITQVGAHLAGEVAAGAAALARRGRRPRQPQRQQLRGCG